MAAQTATCSQARLYNSDERMVLQVGSRNFACVEYPGIVENVGNALQTLGGIKSVSKSILDEKKKLDLRFRPNDIYCKPACGVNRKTAGLLLRVRRRKRQPSHDLNELTAQSGSQGDSETKASQNDGYEYKVDVLGTVTTAIKFEGMCDFQYLPVVQRDDGSQEALLDKLVMNKLTPQSEYMSRDAPLFLSPILFSRLDSPSDFGLMLSNPCEDPSFQQPTETVAVVRKKRGRHTHLISFADPSPTEPQPDAVLLAERLRDSGLKEATEELFEERPVWPKSALMYRLRHHRLARRHLKDVLSSLAYCFLTGPWRTFWIKFGYDPRQDPGAKKFQGVDFRHRPSQHKDFGENMKIQAKRSSSKKQTQIRKVAADSEINLSLLREDEEVSADKREPKLKDFEFHPDVLPPCRQVCYMICDIFDAEIQELASKNDGKERKCDERDGWCVPNFTDCARSIMARHVDKLCPDTTVPSRIARKKLQKRKKLMDSFQDMEDEDANSSLDAPGFEDISH